MNWKEPGPNCIKHVQNATESLLAALWQWMYVVQTPYNKFRRLHLRGRDRALMAAKTLRSNHVRPGRVTHTLGVLFDFSLHYVSHVCHVSSCLYWSFVLIRTIQTGILRLTLHTVWIMFLHVPLEWGETGRETSQCDLGIKSDTKI